MKIFIIIIALFNLNHIHPREIDNKEGILSFTNISYKVLPSIPSDVHTESLEGSGLNACYAVLDWCLYYNQYVENCRVTQPFKVEGFCNDCPSNNCPTDF